MKIEGYLFGFVALFLGGSALIYWFTSHDPTGTGALSFGAGLGVLIGSYSLFTSRRIEPRPEDLPDADIEEGAGEIGFFSPHSWWPLPTAASVAVVALGFVFGWWLLYIGAAFLTVSLIGFLLEYYVTGQH